MIDPVARPQDQRGAQFLATVRQAVSAAVVGGEQPLRLLATALLAGGHALVEDVPGVGKTLLARAFARALGLTFARVQGTPDLLPTDITGSSILDKGQFRFIPGPVFANVLLVDEINRATPRTQSALLEAMQEGQVSAEGQTRPLPDPFLVLATQISMGYPDEDAERRIARRHQASAEPLDDVPTVIRLDEALELRATARTVHVSEDVERYAVALVRATREHPDVRLGASPRSSVALYRVGQAWALLDGRNFVLPDDVRTLAHAVLAHRLLLEVDRELRGATVAGVVQEVIDNVPVPMADEAPSSGESVSAV